jgi:hypothetical protein
MYGWSSDCLGPSGNWKYWTIKNEKIYFFFKSDPKGKFLDGIEQNILAGDIRWNDWFPDIHEAKCSTRCTVTAAPDSLLRIGP